MTKDAARIILFLIFCTRIHLGRFISVRKNGNGKICIPFSEAYSTYGVLVFGKNDTGLTKPDLLKPFDFVWQLNSEDSNPTIMNDQCVNNEHSLEHRTDDPLWQRSLCPWTWRANHDPKRLPASLPEVVCHCDKAAVRLSDRQRIEFECETLHYSVKVLRFVESCGGYVEDYEHLSVACVAIKQIANVMNRGHLRHNYDTDNRQ